MTSTLNRTLTDSMEDELMLLPLEQHSNLHQTISNVSNGSNSDQAFFNIPAPQQHQPQITSNTHHISHDFSEFLHLNGSQDSLKPIKEDIRHHAPSNASAAQPFNSYANPNIFTNSQFPSDFYQNTDYTFVDNRSQSNNSSINNMQQQQQQQQQSQQQVSMPIQNIQDSRSFTNNNYNVGYNNNIQQFVDSISLIEDNNDVSVVPQDMYFNMMGDTADYSDMFLLNNGDKNQKSKQLNIFQPLVSSVHYSDDEDDDEDDFDMDNSNRNISDADMEMDLYGLSDNDSTFALDPTANDDDYFLDNNNNNFAKDTISSAFKNIQISNNIPNENLEFEDLGNQSDASEDIYTPALLGQSEHQNQNQNQNEDEAEAETSSLRGSIASREQIHQDTLFAGQSFTLPDANTDDKPQTEELDAAINAMNSENDENAEHICKIINPKTGLPCLKKFSRPYDLTRHEKSIHATKRLFYRCMFCEDDERRKIGLDSNHPIVISCDYRNSKTSLENSMASRHTNKKAIDPTTVDQYLSNKTFSRGDALTRHLKSKHELNTDQVASAVDYAKEHVEFKNQDA